VHPFSCGFSYSSPSQSGIKTYFKPKCDVISRKIKTLQILECEDECEDFFKWAENSKNIIVRISTISPRKLPKLIGDEVWPLGQSSLTHMGKWVHGLSLTTPHPSCTQKGHWMSKHQTF
jgi:hypothetical protein